MPVISTRRYSTSTGSSSFLPPSVGGTTSTLTNLGTSSSGYSSSSYRSSSLSNTYLSSSSSGSYSNSYSSSGSSGLYPRTSSYRTITSSGLYGSSSSLTGGSGGLKTSSYRHSTYLSGGNNDSTSATASRYGVSNNISRYTRSSSDRDTSTTATTKRITGKTSQQSNNNTTAINRTSIAGTSIGITTKSLQTKPPISIRRDSRGHLLNNLDSHHHSHHPNHYSSSSLKNDQNCNNLNSIHNINNNNNNGSGLIGQEQTGSSSGKFSSSLSSSSLARQVATSGLELYEKYSPAHYTPKCELSRSRSLSDTVAVVPLPSSSSSSGADTDGLTNVNTVGTSAISGCKSNHENYSSSDNQQKDVVKGTTLLSSSLPPSSSSLSSTSNNTPSSSSSKDISTTQLANKVRNTSIRSGLPSSPTPSRYWDREGRSSSTTTTTTGTNRALNNDSSSTDEYAGNNKTSSSSASIDSVTQEGLCGLRNIGNTCFMNSVIQCLSHTKELTKYLKTVSAAPKSNSKDQQILYEFSKLIREMWTPSTRSVTPLDLKSAFSSKHRMYSGYNQQDAQEFLRFFLDSLHCALNVGVKGDALKLDDSQSDNKKADLTWEWYSRIENSVIKDLFVGQLKSTLRCTSCGNTSVTFDPFWDLSVPLHSSSRCKLDSCLDLFIREEILDGDEMPTCSKCQTRRKCTKTFTIQRFPKYLVIHLKRFSETRWSKLSNLVEFPVEERGLNMGPYASNPNTNAVYSLYAISNHMGSTAGGHYVALCKHPVTKVWHEFNDNVVSDDLSENSLVSSSAYLLFYERAD